MLHKTASLFTLSTLAALTAAFYAAPPADHADPRDIVGTARISLLQAMAAATAACPGAPAQAELEGETDKGELSVFYEIMIVGADGHLHEVRIDPVSGAVLTNVDHSATHDEAEGDEEGDSEAHELLVFRDALRQAELALPALVVKAAEIVHGTPVKAELELEHGDPVCDLTIVNGRYLIQVEVEARAGHLVELELVRGTAHDGAEEHGEHRERKEHEDEEHGEHAEHGEGGERHEREARGKRK